MHDLIVVGGGPAGLTAAVYALRKRLEVILVSEDLGGMTRFHWQVPGAVEHRVIRGMEVVERFQRELNYLEFAHRAGRVERIEADPPGFRLRLEGGEVLPARAVVVATGCRAPWLNVPGAERFLGRGVGYSAVSYGHLYPDQAVLVTGNGWRALLAALDLSVQTRQVHLAGDLGPFLASETGRKLKGRPQVIVHEGAAVAEIRGEEAVLEVMLREADGRLAAVAVEAVFVEEELVPNSGLCAGLAGFDERGFIMIDLKNRTSRPGLFAAGDVTNTHIEQVLVAVGEGAKAALSAYEYLLALD